MVESRPGGRVMSYDALMRWEWEGGTPSSARSQRDDARVEHAPQLEQSPPLRSRKPWLRLRCERR
jgi:hypothetical protein